MTTRLGMLKAIWQLLTIYKFSQIDLIAPNTGLLMKQRLILEESISESER